MQDSLPGTLICDSMASALMAVKGGLWIVHYFLFLCIFECILFCFICIFSCYLNLTLLLCCGVVCKDTCMDISVRTLMFDFMVSVLMAVEGGLFVLSYVFETCFSMYLRRMTSITYH